MERSLDEIISENQRRKNRGPRNRRGDIGPRDGVRKSFSRDRNSPRDLDQEWVHDRFEDDPEPPRPAVYHRPERRNEDVGQAGAKLKIENLHYTITEDELRDLFEEIGPTTRANIVWDRQGRSTGVGYVTFQHETHARRAIREFDGANAKGQRIHIYEVPLPASARPGRSLFDRVERPSRPLEERIERPVRRDRSASPDTQIRRSDVSKPPPDHIDRYVPGQRNDRRRSPLRRRGRRDMGRRPGEKRNESGRRDRDESGRQVVGGRPRKTTEELDAEMEDYWGHEESAAGNGTTAQNGNGQTAAGEAADDIDMIE